MSVETHDSTVWDGYDVVNKSLEKGILLTKDVVRFFKKRLEIEEVYCKSLQKAVQKFEPVVTNGFIGDHLAACWQEIRAETEVQASLHESMLSAMKEFVCDPFENLVLDLEAKYKTFAMEGQKSLADTKESVSKLKKVKIGYDKLYRESMDVGTAAGAGTASKRDTQKLQRRTLRLTHELIKADGDYKIQIAETNAVQNIYVKDHIPKLMTVFNNMESVRLHIFKNYLIKYYTTIETLPHTFPNHKRNIVDLLNMTSGEEDITEFLSKNKTQIAPPKPFEYEPTIDEPPPTTKPGRPVSTQLTPAALASIASGGKKEPSPAISPSPSPSLTSISKRSDPIPTPTKKEGLFSTSKTPSSSKKDSSSPPVSSSMPSSSSKKRDVPLQNSNSKGRDTTSPPLASANKDKETRNWWFRTKRHSQHNIRPKHSVFGVKMDEIMVDQKHDHPDVIIPYLLVVLRDVIIKMDGPRTEGIFRVPGNANDVIAFKKQFDDGNYEIVTDNVHTAAAIFKLWLRELPDPVFPYAIYEKCLVASASATSALAMVDQLPEVNRNVLRFVIQLLLEISKYENITKMGIDNLAMVFAPCLLRSMSSDPARLLENSTKEKEFIVALMENLPMPGGVPTMDIDSPPPPTSSHTSSSSPSTPSTTPPSTTNHLSTSGHSELTSSFEDDAPSRRANTSLSAILEEEESPLKKTPSSAKTATPVVTKPTAPTEVPVVAMGASLLDDGDELQAPMAMVASTTFSPRQPSAPQVQEAHRVRAQVRAESIASHLATYLQNLQNVSQSEASTTKMHNATTLLKQKLMTLDEFLHNLTPQTLPEAKKESSSPFLHLRPNYTVPFLPSSADSAAQEAHAELARVVIQVHERLHALACRAEVSNSASEVKTTKKLLKNLKIEIVEKPIDEGDKQQTEANGVEKKEEERAEAERGAEGAEKEEEGEVDAVEILKSLETRVAAKRALLEANEDELDADAVADLTEKRMAFARAISPIKKDLDQFCKECKIEVVADARYPVDDMNSEVKFLRKMILHVIARICYLTQEGVAYIQQQTDPRQARDLHNRLRETIEMLS